MPLPCLPCSSNGCCRELLLDPLKPNVIGVKADAPRIRDARWFNRNHDVVSASIDSSSARVAATVFERELQLIFADELACAVSFRCGTLPVAVPGTKPDLCVVTGAFDTHLKDRFAMQVLLIRIFAGQRLTIGCTRYAKSRECK